MENGDDHFFPFFYRFPSGSVGPTVYMRINTARSWLSYWWRHQPFFFVAV